MLQHRRRGLALTWRRGPGKCLALMFVHVGVGLVGLRSHKPSQQTEQGVLCLQLLPFSSAWDSCRLLIATRPLPGSWGEARAAAGPDLPEAPVAGWRLVDGAVTAAARVSGGWCGAQGFRLLGTVG